MTVQRVMKKQTTLKNEAYIPEGWDSMSSDANGGSTKMTGYEQLRIVSPYPIKIIEEIRLDWKPNEHGKLIVRGLVDDSQQVEAVLKAATGDTIRLMESTEAGEHPIFSGIVSEARGIHRAGVYLLEIVALSGTAVLDVQKKRRSFQDPNMTYEALMKAVLAEYSGADAIVLEGGKENIGEPIVQYDETDWEFLKRIASHSQAVVISDILEARPRMWIGVPDLGQIEFPENAPYTASKNIKQFSLATAEGARLHDTDFFHYEIQSGERYRIGNETWLRNKRMIVSEVRASMNKGQFVYTYRLARRNGIRQSRIHNENMAGISLDGEVLDVQESRVKLHLSIDKKQSKEAAYWFPFTPPTGNVMYSMPQIGTRASLYFASDEGGKARVIGCVRTNGEDCAKTGNPNNRYFGTEHGSELEITPTAINIVSGSQEPLKISIDDEQGIILTSHRKLIMNATEDISLSTPKRIVIKTPNLVVAKRLSKRSGFTIESEFHFLGDQVNMDGRDRTSYPKYDDEPQTFTPENSKKKFGWGKLLVAVAAVAVVVAAVAVSVATFGAGAVVAGALFGAACGAVAGVVGTAIGDIARGEMSSGWDYLKSAGLGALVGAVSGAIFGPMGSMSTVGGTVGFGALTNGVESLLEQGLEGNGLSASRLLFDMTVGGATAGGLNSGVAKQIGSAVVTGAKKVAPWIEKGMTAAGTKFSHFVEKAAQGGDKLASKFQKKSVTPEGIELDANDLKSCIWIPKKSCLRRMYRRSGMSFIRRKRQPRRRHGRQTNPPRRNRTLRGCLKLI